MAQDAALRKRQQIAKSNRTMFLWVAGASILVGTALVVAWFMGQKIVFNQQVLAEKQSTISTLEKNNEAIHDLKDNIRALEANEYLNNAKAKSDDKALQVVLDALPADANSLALGASLQKKFIDNTSGLRLEALAVDPVSGVENTSSESSDDDDEDSENTNTVGFRMTVSAADATTLKELLTKFERSIRVIDINALTLESTDSRLNMTIDGQAYYEPARVIELKDKVVKP